MSNPMNIFIKTPYPKFQCKAPKLLFGEKDLALPTRKSRMKH